MKSKAIKTEGNPYTSDEVIKLQEMWPTASIKQLEEAFPTRSIIGLRWKANKLGLICETQRCRRGTLKPLLNQSLVSYYWLGFILADGHISKTGQLVVTLNKIDYNHLSNLAGFLNTSVSYPYKKGMEYYKPNNFGGDPGNVIRVAVQDPIVALEIKNILGLGEGKKTYNPPKTEALQKMNTDQLTSLFIGFLDGDGSISSHVNLNGGGAQNHISWLPFYQFFADFGIFHNLKFTTDPETVHSHITKQKIIELYHFINVHQIPAMLRKWDKVRKYLNNQQLNVLVA